MGGGEEKDGSNKSFLVLLRKECSTEVKVIQKCWI